MLFDIVMAKLRGSGVPHYNFEQSKGTVVLVPNETIYITFVVIFLTKIK